MLHFGIDVSRDKLDCAVVDEQGQRAKRGRTFKNDAEGIIDLTRWARQIAVEQPLSMVMEATAAYHELAAARIHLAGLIVSVVNPAQVRALAKGLGMLSKTDSIDALLLAQYSRLARPRQWLPTESTLKDFSAMLMRLDCLEGDLRRERNRREQAAVCSPRFGRVHLVFDRRLHRVLAQTMQGHAQDHRLSHCRQRFAEWKRHAASHDSRRWRKDGNAHGSHSQRKQLQ